MNCPKCNALVPTGATVCPTCGEKMPAPTPAKKKLPIPLIAGGAGALVLIIILIIAFAGSGAKGVVSKQIKAYDKEDGKYIYQVVPQLFLDYQNEDLDDDEKLDEEDFIKELDNMIDEDSKNRPDGFKEKYKVVNTKKVKKAIVDQFNEYLDKESDYKDVYDEKEHKITAAYILEVKYEYAYEDFSKDIYKTVTVIKEDGKWKDASYLDISFDWDNGEIADEDEEAYEEFCGYLYDHLYDF